MVIRDLKTCPCLCFLTYRDTNSLLWLNSTISTRADDILSDWVSICFSNVVRLKLRLELLRRCLKGPKLGTDFKRKPADLKKKVDAGWKCWYSSSVVVVVHVVSVLWFLFSKNGEIAKLAICARGRMGLISLPYQLLFLAHGNRYKFVFYFANKLMICLYARELNSLKNIKRSVQKPE